jgi:xanthine dehydrogenase accessory factor
MAREHPLTAVEAAELALEALRGGEPAVSAAVVEGCAGVPRGARMVVRGTGRIGTLGDAGLDADVEDRARGLLAAGPAGPASWEHAGCRVVVYLEPHRAPPELVLVGAGHLARPLCTIGAMLGFVVRVLDDRPGFATRERFPEAAEVRRVDFAAPFDDVTLGPRSHLVLVTRGHRYDFEALRDALRRGPRLPYIGMVGSRRRVRAALEQLAREGIAADELARVHAPIGLDVGAETPEEIAVAVAAELVLVRRGGSGAPLRDRERVFGRWIERRDEG